MRPVQAFVLARGTSVPGTGPQTHAVPLLGRSRQVLWRTHVMAVLDGRGTKGERQLKWQVVPGGVLWQGLLAMLGMLGVEHGLDAQIPLP